ncbi:MAG: polyprenol monophosphomannose synthase [Brevinematales bacterium]|nr:polyprenol monophosphomannose synthase [Brevinematales bacterium]
MNQDKLLVVIPTYNESENISEIIQEILISFDKCDILVVDDNSPDGTAEIVKSKFANNSRVNIIVRHGKRGLGRAYVDGFKWGIEKGYGYLLGMDADFSHDPKEIPNFYKKLQEYDVVVGSRYLNGIRVLNWDLKRLILSQLGTIYARIITGLKLTDMTGGFNGYRAEVLKSIGLDKIDSNGYAFQIELKFRSYVKGFKIIEIPIIFKEREKGYSKMNKRIILEAMFECIKLRINKILGRI